ncbi:hypothetical protein HYPDE_32373 [Hyphomicrobium denitrificans 1NES1]|uniref:Methyltransferase domain-containing protein n=1 Tax=Hyphomicrobium denitrificans 1NES1 TaxID=670307 RepID=N0B571_9HYPH|nr:class I SAM-dependent methyltransferase [Hyphomicrobium denitrificans]AGK58148.1 hypothetical protein HYPDE_32373 [Hyphomicrobium denitrificans 1NES1]
MTDRQDLAQLETRLLALESKLDNFEKTMKRALDDLWSQNEGLAALYRLLDGKSVLPKMRGWAASPDFLRMVSEHILEHRPRVILECGCGSSTIIMGYLVESYGGSVTSIENIPDCADKVRAELTSRKLDQSVSVISCNLKTFRYGPFSHDFNWYDLSFATLPAKVDMLVVDGPFGGLNPLARYPAGPELLKYLVPGGVIFLDDTKRADEKQLPDLWKKIYPTLEAHKMPAEKGAIELILK